MYVAAVSKLVSLRVTDLFTLTVTLALSVFTLMCLQQLDAVRLLNGKRAFETCKDEEAITNGKYMNN